jgi:hypothetical protein
VSDSERPASQERDDKIKQLQQQLVAALSSARAQQVDKSRRAASVTARKQEERRAQEQERAQLERARADAEIEAERYKAQCILLQGQLGQQQARQSGVSGGAGLAPHPPGVSPPANAGRRADSTDLARADALFGDDAGSAYGGDQSYFGSVLGSGADAEEGRRLMGWKLRVAELKRTLEMKDAAEKRLVFELKTQRAAVKELEAQLATAQRRLEKKEEVYDVIVGRPDDPRWRAPPSPLPLVLTGHVSSLLPY